MNKESAERDRQRSFHKKKFTDKFIELRSSARKKGVSDDQLRVVLAEGLFQTSCQTTSNTSLFDRTCHALSSPAHFTHVIVLLSAVSIGMLAISYELLHDYIRRTPCVVSANSLTDVIFQPKMDCDNCRELRSVPEERNISSQSFYEKYAYSGVPVLIKDAAANWTAMSTFSFKFFKQLYTETKGSLEAVEDECQFFRYKTEFETLGQALNMSDERASFQQGEKPWYIAWSNCHQGIAKKLRSHYQKPYFLPEDSESVPTDWIFLGGSGPGAGMHLDEVNRPSWQAQISGRKTWRLLPSPECYNVCAEMSVTVEKGDIFVVDTNMWFHSTFIHPGEISIAIGSEYD